MGSCQAYLMLQVCVSKLVFSFNYDTASLLISWYVGALIYFEATLFSLTVTLMLMTSVESIGVLHKSACVRVLSPNQLKVLRRFWTFKGPLCIIYGDWLEECFHLHITT